MADCQVRLGLLQTMACMLRVCVRNSLKRIEVVSFLLYSRAHSTFFIYGTSAPFVSLLNNSMYQNIQVNLIILSIYGRNDKLHDAY